MKKILLVCAILIALFAGCGRENGETYHSIEAEGYTLTVRGMRIMKESQVAEIPIDTAWYFGDTVRIHEEVTALALWLEDLSEGVISYREPTFFKGYYVLSLVLVNRPGSDHEANAGAALRNLCDWGYITIDSIPWQDVTVVRHGERPEASGPTTSYGTRGLDINIPKALLADSVGNTTLGEWMEGWMDSRMATDNELFQMLATHGYDTLHTAPPRVLVYPHAQRRYDKHFFLFSWL